MVEYTGSQLRAAVRAATCYHADEATVGHDARVLERYFGTGKSVPRSWIGRQDWKVIEKLKEAGLIAREVKDAGFTKIASLAEEVV